MGGSDGNGKARKESMVFRWPSFPLCVCWLFVPLFVCVVFYDFSGLCNSCLVVHLLVIWNLTCALLGNPCCVLLTHYQCHLLLFPCRYHFWEKYKTFHMWHVLIWCVFNYHPSESHCDEEISSMASLTISSLASNSYKPHLLEKF